MHDVNYNCHSVTLFCLLFNRVAAHAGEALGAGGQRYDRAACALYVPRRTMTTGRRQHRMDGHARPIDMAGDKGLRSLDGRAIQVMLASHSGFAIDIATL